MLLLFVQEVETFIEFGNIKGPSSGLRTGSNSKNSRKDEKIFISSKIKERSTRFLFKAT